jgi:hypothetical protein
MTETTPVYSDAQLVAELRRIAALLTDGPLTTMHFGAQGSISTPTLQRRFGSWRQALEAAGLADRYSGRTVSAKVRQQHARRLSNNELRQIPTRTGRPDLTGADLRARPTVSKRVYVSRFGSWPAALAAAGLTIAPRGRRYWSDELLAANLGRVIQEHGRTPILADLDRPPSSITSGTYRRRSATSLAPEGLKI